MKSLIIVIAVILAVILAMGGLSSLSGSLSDIVSTTGVTDTTSISSGSSSDDSGKTEVDTYMTVYSYDNSSVYSGASLLGSYDGGLYSPSDFSGDGDKTVYLGYAYNDSTSEAVIAYSISGLTVGRFYVLRFYVSDLPYALDLRYRFFSGGFTAISSVSVDGYYTISFFAASSEIQISLISYSEIPEYSKLKADAAILEQYFSFKFYCNTAVAIVDLPSSEVIV